ncbi:MAG TPA: hypothetical protein VML96_12055 [Egibacteraceae bacterium]|nr:hypothetical protein [Egibacteraceae bacterium]
MPRLTILVVPAGVVLGHLAAYGLAHPHAAARDEALAGHGHFTQLALAAVVLGLVGAGWAAVRDRRGRPVDLNWRRLAAWQLIGFAGLEVGERVIGGLGAAAAAGEPALWIGLAAQLPSAALVAIAVRAFPMLAAAVAGPIASLLPWRPPGVPIAPMCAARGRTDRRGRPAIPRAPPTLLCSA